MKKIFYKIFVFINILLVIALALSYLSIYVSPETFWQISFFGLAYPYLAISNLLFVIYWMLRKKKIYFISLLTLIIGAGYVNDFIQINLDSDANSSLPKIMSYNVRLFDLYSWSEKMESKNSIFNLLKEESPDIICFQEFYNDKTEKFTTVNSILKVSNTNFTHDAYTQNIYNKYFFGIATFSTFPIVNKDEIRFKNTNNICIYTDLKIKNDTIRIYNSHLQSVHFMQEDYDMIDSIKHIGEKNIKRVKGIVSKIKDAFKIRARQVEIISSHIKTSPYPVFVCGDFNDTPVSYTYKKMSDGLIDAYAESGNGIGTTYNGKIPLLRIDFLLHSSQIKSSEFKIIKCDYSDHYPISCRFELDNQITITP